MDFESMLAAFSQAAAAGDARRLTQLFTPDGCYHDYFFGTHRGHAEIAAMLERFSVGGERFGWQLLEPVANSQLGYARYCFSYLSKEPESRGRLIVFEGMSRFRLQDGLIADYAEVFDRRRRVRAARLRAGAGGQAAGSVHAGLARRRRGARAPRVA